MIINITQKAAQLSVLARLHVCNLVKHHRFPLVFIVVTSTVINFLLVFGYSDFQHYLTSDMHGYWERALQIFNGDEKTPNTWVSNAPFYSRVIADIFTWLNFLGINDYRLHVMLSLNILASALGTVSLYFIGVHVMNRRIAALALAAAYAFSYPNLYFNAFLLGEPIAVPLILTAIWLTFRYRNSYKIFFAGALLAFAVGIRPSNGLLGLPCALYILFWGFSFRRLEVKAWIPVLFARAVKAGLFTVAFFGVIFMVVAENYRISDGKLRGITAHSGYNFFLGQSQAHKITSRFDGWEYGFVPSSVAGHPEYGTIEVDIPIYASSRFFSEGARMLEHHPELWIEHLAKFRFLFFDNLFPAVPSVWGFNVLFDPFRYIVFSMLLLCGLIYIPIREKDVRIADVAFFSSIFALCSMSLYMFTVTHQYFLNFSYTVYVLFFMAAYGCIKHFRKYRKTIAVYVSCLILATFAYQGYRFFKTVNFEENIAIKVTQNDRSIFRLEQPRTPVEGESLSFNVNNLNFYAREKLTHGTLGELDFERNFYIDALTMIEVKETGFYMFTFYSDDGYDVMIGDQFIMGHNGLKKMDEFTTRRKIHLQEGTYEMKIRMFQNGVFSGLVGYYRRVDNEVPFAPWYYDTRKGHGKLIGEDSNDIEFHLPDA